MKEKEVKKEVKKTKESARARLKLNIPSPQEMLMAGVHFGHVSKRWSPLMAPYIYAKKLNSHIIDLYKTEDLLKKSCDFLYNLASKGEKILFLGTKAQVKDIVEHEAKKCGAMYITKRWLGGTFTNFDVIKSSRDNLKRLVEERELGKHKQYTKKERLLIARKVNKLREYHEGTLAMDKPPSAIFIVDIKRESTAVKESNLSNIPIVALVDTNSDPKNVDYVIPGNDDAIKSVELIVKTLADVVGAGYKKLADQAGNIKFEN